MPCEVGCWFDEPQDVPSGANSASCQFWVIAATSLSLLVPVYWISTLDPSCLSHCALKSPCPASSVEACPRSTEAVIAGDVVPPKTGAVLPGDSARCTVTVQLPLYCSRSTDWVIGSRDGSMPDADNPKPVLPHTTPLSTRSKRSPSACTLDGPDRLTTSVQLSVTAPASGGQEVCAVIAGHCARVVTVTGPRVTALPGWPGGATDALAVYFAPARMPGNTVETRSVRPSHVTVLVLVPSGPVSRNVTVAPTPPTSRVGLAPRSRSTVVDVVAPKAVSAGCDAVRVRAAGFGAVQLTAGEDGSLVVPMVPCGLTPWTEKQSARPSRPALPG